MPIEKFERNRRVVHLRRLGYSTYRIGKLFKMEVNNVCRIIKRDWEKYPEPTPEEAKELQSKYPKVVIKNPYLK